MPTDLLPWLEPAAQLGATGILAAGVWAVLTGRLIPRATVERDVRGPLQELAAERGRAYEAERARADGYAEQLTRILKVADRVEGSR